MFCCIYSVIGILWLLCCCACKTALCAGVLRTRFTVYQLMYCSEQSQQKSKTVNYISYGKKLKANFVVSNLEESSYMGVIHHEVDTGCM